jgi:predicted transcriptional regulator
MGVKVHELMTEAVVTTQPHVTIGRVRRLLEQNGIGAVPVVDGEGRPVGIVSSTDLVPELNPRSPISRIMTDKVHTVPKYGDVSTAARLMRNRGIHRVVVTHEKRVVGILSTFDLLSLVEGRRFVAKNAPTRSTRRGSRRG